MFSPIFAHRFLRPNKFGPVQAVVVLALTAAFATPVLAIEPALTLAQAQRLAVERSRALSAKGYASAASRDMAVAAGQLPDPVLRVGIENLPVNGPERFSTTSDFMTMRSVGIMQEITRGDKRHWRAERFLREADRSEAEKSETMAAIQRDTALAWLERYYAEAMAKVIAEQGTQAKFEIQGAEGAYRAGRGTQAEVIAAKGAISEFDNRASEAQRRIRNAKTMLVRWIGTEGDLPLASHPPIDTIRLNLSDLETHLAHHPRIAVLTKQVEVAEAEAKLAQANKKADWSVELMYQQRGPEFSNMASVNVSIPLQWDQKNRQDRELAAKLAMLEEAKAERDELLRAHVAETRTMVNEWENTRERVARFERELIPLAQQRTLAAIAAYRGGKTMLSDVLAARRNEINVRLEALQLQTEAARLWAQLNYLFPDDGVLAYPVAGMNREFK